MLPHITNQALRANKAGNIVYLNNPKVGCSTVKFNLWKALSPDTAQGQFNEHDLEGSPFSSELWSMDWLENASIFTFARNPFVRVVSAYLNKIVAQEKAQWHTFVRRYKVDPVKVLPFDAFISHIAADTPEDLDPHWRPQSINIMYPFIRPNALGKLERMDEALPKIMSRFLGTDIAETPRKAVHSTQAQKNFLGYLGNPETVRKIIALYYDDFTYFGYFMDPDAPVEGKPVELFSDHAHPRLAGLAALRNASQKKDAQEILLRLQGLIADDPLARSDRPTRSWLLNSRLEAAPWPATTEIEIIRDNMEAIVTGPDYLRRTAARITAGLGAWHMCNRITAASLR